MKKFTFKKTIHEGRYKSFEKDHTTIKLNKLEVGYISEINFGEYKVYFAVKRIPTSEEPAPFRWIRIKQTFKGEKEAREWIRLNCKKIQDTFDLHYFED